MKKRTILLTGAAGFIGAWTAKALVERGHAVVGVDNFNPYYDPQLKKNRLAALAADVPVYTVDIADQAALARVLDQNPVDQICHLAAQAGVRHSLKEPFTYEASNNLGTLNLLELARHRRIKSFVYASSSSVYGGNKKIPFSVDDPVDHPVSLYAATKRANELTAHAYHHLYGIHCTGLRFFTVYGPWGRPDMALFGFTKAILEGNPIEVFNRGKMMRDFTFISDIVDGVLAALEKDYPYEIFNLGHSKPVSLTGFIAAIEKAAGRKAQKILRPMQAGDVPATWADIKKSTRKLGFKPVVPLQEGVDQFVAWYRRYFHP